MNPTHDNLGQPSGITFEHQDTRGSTDRIVLYDFVLKRIRERWDNKEGRYRGEADDENDRRRGRASDAGYAFCIVKFFKPSINPNRSCVSVVIQVRSPHFVKAAEAVMEGKRDIAWKARPARFDAEEILSFLPQFDDYLSKPQLNMKDPIMIHHLEYFMTFLKREYNSDLAQLEVLKREDLVSFYTIWGVLVPGTTLVYTDELTQDPCFVRLVSFEWCEPSPLLDLPEHYSLCTEFVDIVGGKTGLTEKILRIPRFDGPRRITDLPVYPANLFFSGKQDGRKSMIERGRKYYQLAKGWSHAHYDAIAYRGTTENVENGTIIVFDPEEGRNMKDESDDGDSDDDDNNDESEDEDEDEDESTWKVKYRKVIVKSRIMIDRDSFDCYAPYPTSPLHVDLDGNSLWAQSRTELNDEEFLLLPTRLYGFCLTRQEWLEFRSTDVQDVQWNPGAFDNLQLFPESKAFVRALVETHIEKPNDMDFVRGKGAGLIFNLHGPPCVGKTLTAEATSEVTGSPLWKLKVGDLGTTAAAIDSVFSDIAQLASRWKAVVLIDEADVFLEKRDNYDIYRNAIVAVFLRQLEYYPGILFLTSNRANLFDPAIQARIHVSLYYRHLDAAAKEHIWFAFLRKADIDEAMSPQDLHLLVNADINGRQIRNIVKISLALAAFEGRPLKLADVMDTFSFILTSSLGAKGAGEFSDPPNIIQL
ncbi:hypothetical protein VKT23_018965 [Stygiomarasmius scandens]|uniref:AAA+ ATPase domain-containing protein n=1 Tax=Marasmiellus scandens TaxID=2682957 RepID=A0ABR1IQM0_9AGAR